MPIRYHLTLPHPVRARGSDPALAFAAHGADEYAAQLQDALRRDALFLRWKASQDDPEAVDPALGATDPQASVHGSSRDLGIALAVATTLPGHVLKHRLRLLAGPHWELHDVTAG